MESTKKIAILQSNYIPWKGYFDIIHDVDEFIFYDEVQYTKNDWRNRNKIKTQNGAEWLSVPVKGSMETAIDQTLIVIDRWQQKHYQALLTNYSKAHFFKQYKPFLEHVYLDLKWEYLSDLNQYLITKIAHEFLGISSQFTQSTDYISHGSGHVKLLSLLDSARAETYVSGPAAKDYIIATDYEHAGIKIIWKDYVGYPEYPQLFPPFSHQVSIFDVLFNTGADAPYFIWGWRENSTFNE